MHEPALGQSAYFLQVAAPQPPPQFVENEVAVVGCRDCIKGAFVNFTLLVRLMMWQTELTKLLRIFIAQLYGLINIQGEDTPFRIIAPVPSIAIPMEQS